MPRKRNNPETPSPTKKLGTPRPLIITARVIILGFLALLILLGARTLFSGTPKLDIASAVPALKESLTPDSQVVAENAALQFLHTYLTITPGQTLEREDALAALAPTLDTSTWQTDPESSQRILSGPYLTSPPQPLVIAADNDTTDTTHQAWEVTATALIQNGDQPPTWVTLAVPATIDTETLNYAVTGTPVFAPTPSPQDLPSPTLFGSPQTDLSEELRDPLTEFFADWAASDTVRLARWITPTASSTTQTGLNKSVTLTELRAVTAYQVDGDPNAYAVVTVIWNRNKTQYAQDYLLTLTPTSDGLWAVDDIGAPGFSP